MTRTYAVATAITAYQTYNIEAEDEQAAIDKVWDAIHGEGDPRDLYPFVDGGYNDDEQIIEAREVRP